MGPKADKDDKDKAGAPSASTALTVASPQPTPDVDEDEARLLAKLDAIRQKKAEAVVRKVEAACESIRLKLGSLNDAPDGRWWLTREGGAWQVRPAVAARAATGNGGGGGKRAIYEADVKAGLTTKQIALKYGVSASTVWAALHPRTTRAAG